MDSWCLPWLLLSEGLLLVFGMPTPETFEIDIDGGKYNDIFEINEALGLDLLEGDIILDKTARNAIANDCFKWPTTIPYVFDDTLDINAKGIILKAFERYHLKTCIDFKPWEGEENYILLYKGHGCNSAIGKRGGVQKISIGQDCDKVGVVQHELFHALGFWHEQARPDRNDYVVIMKDRIAYGKIFNFRSSNDNESIFLNVPYDYLSVMHYSKNSFRRGIKPTIITKIPAFMNLIGQRIDFSNYDIQKLNQLYNCTSSRTFLDSCDFTQENICGMIQNSEDNGDWQRVSHVPGGPNTDQSNLSKCKGCGFFMYFNSSSLNVGEKAILESRIFYPKRGFQCLQFYYYNSGNEDDQLKIYVRVYVNVNGDEKVLLNLVNDMKDQPIGSWQLHYVPLTVTNKFRVVFEGTRGTGTLSGGLSIDDINLSETHCPHHIWKLSNFTQLNSSRGVIFSSPFYSPIGYAYQVQMNFTHHKYIGIYFSLISGANDEKLLWPCPWQQVTLTILDQNPDIRQRMDNERSVTTNPFKKFGKIKEMFQWDKPSKVGMKATFPNGTSYRRGIGYGSSVYITHEWMQRRDFIKGDTVYILISMEDISHLINTSSFIPMNVTVTSSKSHINLCTNLTCQNDGICVSHNDKEQCRCQFGGKWCYMGEKCELMASTWKVIKVILPAAVFVAILIVIPVSFYCAKKKYKNKEQN